MDTFFNNFKILKTKEIVKNIYFSSTASVLEESF